MKGHNNMKRKFLSIILILSIILSFAPVVSNAAASDVTKLINVIKQYGTVNSNGSISLQDKSYNNGYTITTSMTYRSSDNIIIFHFNMSKQGLSCTISFDYDIASQKAKNNTISANYLNDSLFSSVMRKATFDIGSYTQKSTLNFTTGTINMNPPSNINETFNDITQAAVASWNKLCYQKAGVSINKIGFDSYYSSNVPSPTPTPTYTVKYDANGGTDAPSEQTAKSGESITIPSQIPTRKYYDFLGWSTSKTAQTAAYTSGDNIRITSNTTLYAVWQKIPMPDTTGNKLTISNAQINGNTVSFTAELSSGEEVQGVILVVAYDISGTLVDVKKYSAAASMNISFEKKDNYDTAKIFWWFDTDSMYPMANSESLKLDEAQRTYSITKEYDSDCGSVTITANGKEIETAAEGEQITIKTFPNNGYGALYPTVTDASGNTIKITNNTFTMPKDNVKVAVTFVGIKDNGIFGTNNNLNWLFDNNGTLTINGSGQMQDFTTDNMPWNKYKADIKIVVIGGGVTRISKNAFADCSKMKRVLIDKSITEIEAAAFKNCADLSTVEYSGSQSDWEEIYIGADNEQLKNANFIFNSSLSDTAQTDLDYLKYTKNEDNTITITNCLPDAVKINISKEIDGLPVTTIGENAFSGCGGLTSVTIPDSVTSIEDYAFSSCPLTSVIIPNSVTNLGIGVFSGCSDIKTAVIGNGVTNISELTFSGCSGMVDVVIPDSVTAIGGQSFYDCGSLTKITIPDNVTSIDDSAFSGCSGLTSVTIPDSVTIIGSSAFEKCSGLTSVEIPDSVTIIDDSTFSGCSGLTSVTIPDSVTSIGDSAFKECSGLTSVEIPDSVTIIDDSTFSGCSGLTSVTIPDSVTSIGIAAFEKCDNLDSIYITDLAAYLNIEFGNEYSNPMCYANKLYINNKRIRSVEIPDGVTKIPACAFCGCDGVTNITIPDSVTSIGDRAFEGCSSITSIAVPDNVISIGKGAFNGCNALTEITLPFVGKSKTASKFYEKVFGYIFGYTVAYNSVNKLPSNTTYQYDEQVKVAVTATTLEYRQAYYGYYIPSSLQKVTITSAEQISYHAFYNCNKLTSITIPNSITSIGNYAFYKCSDLLTVYYQGRKNDWDKMSENNYYYYVNIVYNYVAE